MPYSTEQIEQQILPYLPKEEGPQKRVIEAMNYAFLAGGKRLRPMLMRLAYDMYAQADDVCEFPAEDTSGTAGCIIPAEDTSDTISSNTPVEDTSGTISSNTPAEDTSGTAGGITPGKGLPPITAFMAAIEMIHTYSLIHDDLPCMDNDDLRRGKPTVHRQFDEATALLAGDGLLNYAYEVAAGALNAHPGDRGLERALLVLATKPGIRGMIGGQTLDVALTGSRPSSEELAFIYENKTSALIECALMCGAYAAGAPESEVEILEKIGSLVGLAFQIRDDILDITGSEAVLGKPVNSDEKNEKNTYATIYGIEAAEKKVWELSEEAVLLLDSLQIRHEKKRSELRALLVKLIDRDH